MRFKKPTRVSIEQVQITREGDDAIVDHADAGISGAHLAIGPEIATMTDAEIVDLTFNGPVSVPNSSRRSAKPAARISTDSLRLCCATSALPPLGLSDFDLRILAYEFGIRQNNSRGRRYETGSQGETRVSRTGR
jgi:hypothetical protein